MYNNEFSKEATSSTKYVGYSGWVGGSNIMKWFDGSKQILLRNATMITNVCY